MIGIIARVKIKAGVAAQFEEVANRLVARSREEPGSQGYTLWRTEDPTVYTFVEYYADTGSIEAHARSDHYRSIGRELGAFMDGRPEIVRLTAATI